MAAKVYLQAALEADRNAKTGISKKQPISSPPTSPARPSSPGGGGAASGGAAGGGGALFKSKIGNASGLAKTLMST
jgi:hypothetical protein